MGRRCEGGARFGRTRWEPPPWENCTAWMRTWGAQAQAPARWARGEYVAGRVRGSRPMHGVPGRRSTPPPRQRAQALVAHQQRRLPRVQPRERVKLCHRVGKSLDVSLVKRVRQGLRQGRGASGTVDVCRPPHPLPPPSPPPALLTAQASSEARGRHSRAAFRRGWEGGGWARRLTARKLASRLLSKFKSMSR